MFSCQDTKIWSFPKHFQRAWLICAYFGLGSVALGMPGGLWCTGLYSTLKRQLVGAVFTKPGWGSSGSMCSVFTRGSSLLQQRVRVFTCEFVLVFFLFMLSVFIALNLLITSPLWGFPVEERLLLDQLSFSVKGHKHYYDHDDTWIHHSV